MPATRVQTKSIHLVGGSDEFTVKHVAAKLAKDLAPKTAGEFGVEVIDGAAGNQEEALKILARLHEALNTVGFFGAQKLVWLKSTNLLADETPVTTEAVKDALAELAESLKRGLPEGVRLLISACGLDKRRTMFKTLEKVAGVQIFDAPEAGKQAGEQDIAAFMDDRLLQAQKTMNPAARAAFRELVEPTLREIAAELEKLCLYVGKRRVISAADVRAICSASRQAIVWELTDALGERKLPAALRALDNLLDSGEEPIGLVALLASQFRLMLLARDLLARKVLPTADDKFVFVKAFERLPAEQVAHFPRGKDKEADRPNVWRFHRCAVAAKNFTGAELIRAMDLLLQAHLQLVTTQLDPRLVLEETVVKIAARQAAHSPLPSSTLNSPSMPRSP
jgi:DNA polymerase-3 subunit delta